MIRYASSRGTYECESGREHHTSGGGLRHKYVLKYTENGIKTHRLVTEMVEWSACRVVEDGLTWHDHDIPVDAVQRVEFQWDTKNQSDYLEETMVEMLKWGLHGHTADQDQGLMPCGKRHRVASVWEYKYLLDTWDTVKDEEEPLISLLQLLSQQGQGEGRKRGARPETKVKFLPVDPASYLHPHPPPERRARCSCMTVRKGMAGGGAGKSVASCRYGLWHRSRSCEQQEQ